MRTVVIAALLLCTLVLTGCSGDSVNAAPDGYVVVRSQDGGTVYRTRKDGVAGSFDVVVLNGDWRQMGRQYGALFRKQFIELEQAAWAYLNPRGVTREQMVQQGDESYEAHEQFGKELVQGMEEGSGLGLARQKIVNALIMAVIYTPGCSSMDAWGDYTAGKDHLAQGHQLLRLGENHAWTALYFRFDLKMTGSSKLIRPSFPERSSRRNASAARCRSTPPPATRHPKRRPICSSTASALSATSLKL